LNKVTEEPIAKPALKVGFSIFRKEAHIKHSNFPLRLLRENTLIDEGQKKKITRFGG